MATFYGVEATKRANSQPVSLQAQGTNDGRVKVCYDQFTLTAALAQNDVILLGLLPAGARVLDVALKFSASLDASGGTLDCGWNANLVDAIDIDGFLDAVDVTTSGGGVFLMSDDKPQRPGIHKKFDALGGPTQVRVSCPHAGGLDATTGTISVAVTYVID